MFGLHIARRDHRDCWPILQKKIEIVFFTCNCYGDDHFKMFVMIIQNGKADFIVGKDG